MAALFWIAGVIAGLWAIDRLFLWFEAKGWLYWRKSRNRPRIGAAFTPYLVEEAQRAHEMEEDKDVGDGADTGEKPKLRQEEPK